MSLKKIVFDSFKVQKHFMGFNNFSKLIFQRGYYTLYTYHFGVQLQK